MNKYPIGWQVKELGNVCALIGGGTPAKKNEDFYKGEIPWATVRDMNVDVITQTEFKITDEAIKNSSTNIIDAGNVVIATRVGLGKVCLVNQDTAINQDLRGIVPLRSDVLTVRFLFWWLKSIAHLIEKEGTGATVKGVKLPFVKSLQIPLPPIPEQKRIVSILDDSFAGITQAITNAEKNLANARELFGSYLNSVFTQKGEGWVQVLLSDICDVRDGTHDSPRYVDKGIPFITQKNIREDGLSFEKIKLISELDHEKFYNRSNVCEGDILISMIGVNRGMSCLVDDGRIFSIKNVGLIKANDKVNMSFLLYYLKSYLAKIYIEAESRGGAQPFIGLTKLRKFPISLAPNDIQKSLVMKLDELRLETKRLETIYQKKLTALNELKQSILQKAFTGELTANVVNQQLDN